MFKIIFLSVLLAVSVRASPTSYRNSNVEIVGGHDTDISLHPWQVSIRESGSHLCGGSLVASTWILTAAHCLNGLIDVSNLTIHVGSTYKSTGGKVYSVSKFIVNDDWSVTFEGDIALLKLPNEVNGPNATVIDLPAQDEQLVAGTDLSVTGWGDTRQGSGIGSEVLQEVIVPVVSLQDCGKVYSVTNKTLCAGVSGKDSCQGDSGGPAVADKKLFGIVSRGNGCGQAGYPGLYTNVASYATWINDVINERKLY